MTTALTIDETQLTQEEVERLTPDWVGHSPLRNHTALYRRYQMAFGHGFLKIKKLDPKAVCPERKTDGAGCYDISALEDFILAPGTVRAIPTGLSVEIPPGYIGAMRSRSSLFLKGILVQGEIDSDYRGPVQVMMANLGTDTVSFKAGERIAQLKLHSVGNFPILEVEELTATKRGEGGFGSTGK